MARKGTKKKGRDGEGEGVQYSLFFIQRFKGKVLFNVPMSAYTSIGIGGPADVMAFPVDESDLKDVLLFAEGKDFPCYVFGGGTNLLVRDGGIRGIVINMAEGFGDIVWTDETRVVVGAGVRLQELVTAARDKGLSGLEFACGIPGTVGGAAVMNAGAYGREMKDVVDGVEVVGGKGARTFIPADSMGLGYRTSALPKQSIVTRVHVRLDKSTAGEVRERIREYRERRKTSAAISLPNAGSVFKNPEGGRTAGQLIDAAGLKGASAGGAAISDVHANYIVNLGSARARDVLTLMALARDKVYASTGVLLEPEIKVVGDD